MPPAYSGNQIPPTIYNLVFEIPIRAPIYYIPLRSEARNLANIVLRRYFDKPMFLSSKSDIYNIYFIFAELIFDYIKSLVYRVQDRMLFKMGKILF